MHENEDAQPESNESLVARSASDASRYEQWVRTYEKDCYRFAYRLVGDPQQAADCVQEAFLRTWKYGRFDRITNPKAWLFTTVRNVVLNDARRRRPDTVPLGDWDLATVADDDALARHVTVAKALSGLRPGLLELVVLKYWGGFTDEEIAEIQGIPRGTVKSSLNRARAILRGGGGLDDDPPPEPTGARAPSTRRWSAATVSGCSGGDA